jgi:hypothetical protein
VDTGSEISDRGGVPGPSQAAPGREAIPKQRRRPSGEPPPLPRELGLSGKLLIGLTALAFVALVFIALVSSAGSVLGRSESELVADVARIRAPWLTDLMRAIDTLASPVVLFTTRLLVVVVLVVAGGDSVVERDRTDLAGHGVCQAFRGPRPRSGECRQVEDPDRRRALPL